MCFQSGLSRHLSSTSYPVAGSDAIAWSAVPHLSGCVGAIAHDSGEICRPSEAALAALPVLILPLAIGFWWVNSHATGGVFGVVHVIRAQDSNVDVRCAAIQALEARTSAHSDLTTALLVLCATPVARVSADVCVMLHGIPDVPHLIDFQLVPQQALVRDGLSLSGCVTAPIPIL